VVSTVDMEALRRDFDRDGFVNAGPVLTASEVAELSHELERYTDTVFRGLDTGVTFPSFAANLSENPDEKHFQMGGIWQVSEPFGRLACHPRIGELGAHLARASLMQLWCDTVQYKPPRVGAPFHWHQDAPYHLTLDPPERLVGAWVALDDVDPETGCMWMVPGSYRWGVREHHLWGYRSKATHDLEEFCRIGPPPDCAEAAAEWRAPVPRPMRAGEVHFHHALTWHGSPTNRAVRARRGYSIFLMPEGIRRTDYKDLRVAIPAGASMLEAGPNFPVVFPERATEA
jgi:phytanoyl-CoA hydroxylase